jgi:hypothetical protein
MIERRQFLIGVGAAVAATTLQPNALARANATAAGALTKDRFVPLVGSWFDIDGVSVELIAVVDGPDVPEAEQFSLRFRGASLAAGLHAGWHASLGHFPLYLERVSADTCRADFNLLRG